MNKNQFNEDTRVKIPATIHFTRLGYTYLSKKNANIDTGLNIFIDIFKESLKRINNRMFSNEEIKKVLNELNSLADNPIDKGQNLYNRLKEKKDNIILIDFKNFDNNSFHIVTELPFENKLNNFRPDITILVNGIPLSFLEVKKPNNSNGILAEFNRTKIREKTKEFTKYLNLIQIMSFSNNQPYEDDSFKTLQGSFYSTPNKNHTTYNLFREEEKIKVGSIKGNISDILKDNNYDLSLKNTNEFQTNLGIDRPLNSFITSLYSIKRFMFILKYGISYVKSFNQIDKHIIRYPQLFAIQSLINKLENKDKKMICWMTQGSGKTALTAYALNVLKDYFQDKDIITKFYFVVDRLDLLNQATNEFTYRGLNINNVNSKYEFIDNIKSLDVQKDINVVNIQKFSEESIVKDSDSFCNVQRIYFMDEVHRSYNPDGSFLANLLGSDKNGVFIGLTGTPIIREDYKSTDFFGDYVYKYYYNKSILDGYTLKIKREEINTIFKDRVEGIFGKKDLLQREWNQIMEKEDFCMEITNYIEEDFKLFIKNKEKDNLGFMIVASSTKQARILQDYFEKYTTLKTGLVLSSDEFGNNVDINIKNKKIQNDFKDKENKIYDGLIVYKMLLTGFDCPRLKRLYLLRNIKDHNLLQTLTRVNRPYKDLQYGYIIDFADILEEYELTTKKYLEELQRGLKKEDLGYLDTLFVTTDKIKADFEYVNTQLSKYKIDNLESFSDKVDLYKEEEVKEIEILFDKYMVLYNELRLSYQNDIVEKVDIEKMKNAKNVVKNRLNMLYQQKKKEDKNEEMLNFDLKISFQKMKTQDLDFISGNEYLLTINTLIEDLQDNLCEVLDKNSQLYKQYFNEFATLYNTLQDNLSKEEILLIIDTFKELLRKVKLLIFEDNDLLNSYKNNELCLKFHNIILNNFSSINEEKIIKIVLYINDIIENELKSKGDIKNQGQQPFLTLKRNLYKTFKKETNITLLKDELDKITNLLLDELLK